MGIRKRPSRVTKWSCVLANAPQFGCISQWRVSDSFLRACLLFVFFLSPAVGYAQGAASEAGSKTKPADAAAAGSGAADVAASNCPPPAPQMENASRLRTFENTSSLKKFKVRLDKGGNNVGIVPTPSDVPPAVGDCFFVFAENQSDVVAELAFQKATKNSKGVSVWVFRPVRRSENGKTTVNLNAVKSSDLVSGSAPEQTSKILGENPLAHASFVLIQNAQHQAANVRTGLALNIPVSGNGVVVESFVPPLAGKAWMNMFGLRVHYATWSAEKFIFRKPVANENQNATATGNNLQFDLVFRYPFSFRWLTRLGLFISPAAKQTEILKAEATVRSPQNTQTLERSGLVFGGEAEMLPSENFFLSGQWSSSFGSAVTVKDESIPGETVSGKGTVNQIHLTGMAGVRIPLTASRGLQFEGLVGNKYRMDTYSSQIADTSQVAQRDIVTFFQIGFGYFL